MGRFVDVCGSVQELVAISKEYDDELSCSTKERFLD
jgi:hypothetical protein